MLSHPGHLQTPWPYREWDPNVSSCNELGERDRERGRKRERRRRDR